MENKIDLEAYIYDLLAEKDGQYKPVGIEANGGLIVTDSSGNTYTVIVRCGYAEN